ncbi:MAG TPA: PIN domain-containing protein [Thermoanaerobaculia bacterium]|nr:PIN domain-containing protein [Thermoanaerobaculia bacterium]
MILALDTDVVISWLMAGSSRHAVVRSAVERELRRSGGAVALVPQTLHEVLHVATDPRRFERPLPMKEALQLVRLLWEARDVVRIQPGPQVPLRTLELMERHHLGRKRILDTALAATLEGAGIRRLATFNGDDFRLFPFIDVFEPA